ncbi:hypothetical protein D3C86_1461480 [compost metagenome]
MAGGADFLIDLQAALQLALVIFAEGSGKGPALLFGLDDREVAPGNRMFRLGGEIMALLRRRSDGDGTADGGEKRDACYKLLHCRHPSFALRLLWPQARHPSWRRSLQERPR